MQDRQNHGRRGIALIWMAIVGMVLISLIGLSCDWAYVMVTKAQLQNAADAAAMAGMQQVLINQNNAMATAQAMAALNKAAGASVQLASNGGNGLGGDVVVGYFDRATKTLTPTWNVPNAVHVEARRTSASPGGALALIFGGNFGAPTSDVASRATAMVAKVNAGILVLDPHKSGALSLTGKGTVPKVTVNMVNSPGTYGTVQVNSDSSTAVSWTSGNAVLQVDNLLIGGNEPTAQTLLPAGKSLSLIPPTPDPLASLVPPAKPGVAAPAVNGVYQPGYYANGLPSGKLAAGLYYVDVVGNGDAISGSVDGSAGCLLYLHTGGINLGGNTLLKLRPSTDPAYAAYAGITVYQDRANTSAMSLPGTADIDNTGVLYLPAAGMSLAGNPTSVGSMVICNTLDIQGTATMTINYDGRYQVRGHKVFLVQ